MTTGETKMRRVGLLGAGYIADFHAQALRSLAEVELAAVCDLNLSRANFFGDTHGIKGRYSDLSEMLTNEKLDVVHILLPPNAHFACAKTILAADVDVFLEKPMCATASDCRALSEFARERGRNVGTSHNFLFNPAYEQLRADFQTGALGRIDQIEIIWNKDLPQHRAGPFGIWMLRQPGNIMLEVGPHSFAHLLDLTEPPEQLRVHADNSLVLPNGATFYRRWAIDGVSGNTLVNLRFSFIEGYPEHRIHLRGTLASATVEFEKNLYSLHHHRPYGLDMNRYATVVEEAKQEKLQARRTLRDYVLSKTGLTKAAAPFQASISRAIESFYTNLGAETDSRLAMSLATKVVALGERVVAAAELPSEQPTIEPSPSTEPIKPRVLVFGGTGFIGRALIRQLRQKNLPIRLFTRSKNGVPAEFHTQDIECFAGDLTNEEHVSAALDGIEYVYHLARGYGKTEADYDNTDVAPTRRLAELCLETGVKRLIYASSIAVYYTGSKAGNITEATPPDPGTLRTNVYSKAKVKCEQLLEEMYRRDKLPVVILRPGIVVGSGGHPCHWGIGMWHYNCICEVWGEGRNRLPIVLVEDVADAMFRCMNSENIDGKSFNLVGDPLITARDYLDALDTHGGLRFGRHYRAIWRFYIPDLFKWVVKVAVRHPERAFPSYRAWESRTGKGIFDCSRAKRELGWKPETDPKKVIEAGVHRPVDEFFNAIENH